MSVVICQVSRDELMTLGGRVASVMVSLSPLLLRGCSHFLWLHTPVPFHSPESGQFVFLLRLPIVPTINGNILMEVARMKQIHLS